MAAANSALERLLADIRACRLCVEQPRGRPLPHAPRPVLRVSPTARIAVFGQAPGARVHASGVPFSDPSGVRLRQWMGVGEDVFYNVARVAIVPMGFCFPGLDAKGGDRPPRPECAQRWRQELMTQLVRLDLVLLVGQYAQRWHLGARWRGSLTDTVRAWAEILEEPLGGRRYLPLPHPSWRNNAWIERNPWFEAELLVRLRQEVARAIA